MERLEILRKSLYKKAYGQADFERLEEFIPKEVLHEIARSLPSDRSQLL